MWSVFESGVMYLIWKLDSDGAYADIAYVVH